MIEHTTDREVQEWTDSPFRSSNQKHESIKLPSSPQPLVSDFTEIVASCTQDGYYAVRVLLDSGHVVVTPWVFREDAERLELAITQGMIEYRTKRNAWEKSLTE